MTRRIQKMARDARRFQKMMFQAHGMARMPRARKCAQQAAAERIMGMATGNMAGIM